MSSSRDEDRQQALSHHPQQDLVPPASRPSPPGDTSMQDYEGSSQRPRAVLSAEVDLRKPAHAGAVRRRWGDQRRRLLGWAGAQRGDEAHARPSRA